MKRFKWWFLISTIVLILMASLTLALLGCAFLNTLKTPREILRNIWALPTGITLENYRILLFDESFIIYYKNSATISISVIITAYISAMAAYALSKFEFKGRNLLKGYFIIGLFFPIKLAISSLYILMTQLHLTNKPIGLMILYCSFVSMPVFVITGMMKTVPDSIIESAKIEGAGHIRIFNQMILPIAKPAIGAVVPLLFTSAWNDFMLPATMLKNRDVYTVPLGITLYHMGTFYDISKLNLVFTSVILSILPIVTIYLIFSKQIIAGVMSGSVKE